MGPLAFLRNNAKFLGAGMLLTLNSSFGQTFFISIFAAQIMAAFALSDGEWGMIYAIGTTASAVVMYWAGALTDRYPARHLAWFVMPGLALTCLVMAVNTSAVVLILIVFLLRFFGQGMSFQLATVSMARWFSARRGLALSLSAVGVWVGQACFPWAFAAALERFDWRWLWVLSAGMVMVLFPIVLWLLQQERTPQSLAEDAQTTGMGGRHWKRSEVIRSRLFLLLIPMLLGPPAWGTALFFQQVHIAAVKGWPLVEYLALIPIMTVVSVGVTLVTGMLIDRFGSGSLLRLYPVFWAGGFFILSSASTLSGALLAFVVFGFATGVQTSLITAFWAEYFGTRHIGAIKATSASVMVLGSAIGPGISGLLIDLGFSFPAQMTGITFYFVGAMALVWMAVRSANTDLSAEIDIERA